MCKIGHNYVNVIDIKHIYELQVHMETFGKSGCRRIVPGQYLAIDPKGRAVMIGKLKWVSSYQEFFLILF